MQCSFLQALQQLYTQWPVDRDTGGHSPPGPPDTAPVHVQGGRLPSPGQDRECPQDCGGLTGRAESEISSNLITKLQKNFPFFEKMLKSLMDIAKQFRSRFCSIFKKIFYFTKV